MNWKTPDETPHVFYDIVVKEPNYVYTQHVDSPNHKVRGAWVYAHELVREADSLRIIARMQKSLLNALIQEMRYEANCSEDYSTRKRMDALINLAKVSMNDQKGWTDAPPCQPCQEKRS